MSMAYFIIIVTTIAADQLTKALIIQSMSLYEVREIIPGFFNLVYVTNKGAAFSMFAHVDTPWINYFFVAIAAVAAVVLTVLYFRWRRISSWYGVSFGLIVGGAVGNVIDRLRYGAVTDFLDFYVGTWHWPAFNVADSAICIGAALLILLNFFVSERQL